MRGYQGPGESLLLPVRNYQTSSAEGFYSSAWLSGLWSGVLHFLSSPFDGEHWTPWDQPAMNKDKKHVRQKLKRILRTVKSFVFKEKVPSFARLYIQVSMNIAMEF